MDASVRPEYQGAGAESYALWRAGDVVKYYTRPDQGIALRAAVTIGSGGDVFAQVLRSDSDEFINAVYGAADLKGTESNAKEIIVSSSARSGQTYYSMSAARVYAAFNADFSKRTLRFRNVLSLLQFTSSAQIFKVVISSNGGEAIQAGPDGLIKIRTTSDGRLQVKPFSPELDDLDKITVLTGGESIDFWVSMLPVEIQSGFTLTCYDAKDCEIGEFCIKSPVSMIDDSGSPGCLSLGKARMWLYTSKPISETVDLGLSVRWASYNLGSQKDPSDFGSYISWGETDEKELYSWKDYKFTRKTGKNVLFSKYVIDSAGGEIDGKSILDLQDDAASVNLGGAWRIPTAAEWAELRDSCIWKWTRMDGVYGYEISGRAEGYTDKSIFLPANGRRNGDSYESVGVEGYYWSSNLSSWLTHSALSLGFNSDAISYSNYNRYCGLGVRPVDGTPIPVSDIMLDKSRLSTFVGLIRKIEASLQPINASDKSFVWSSSDPFIASVNSEGMVLGVSAGKARITATTNDGGYTASCEIIVKPLPENAVDLGLSVLWASHNVGTDNPEGYGNYYAFGDTEQQKDYGWSTYKWSNGNYHSILKYNTSVIYGKFDGKEELEPEDDAAIVYWGKEWRMPTHAEWIELINNCTWTWTTLNEVNGYLVTSNRKGYTDRYIFLPAAGYRDNTTLHGAGSFGYYWSSSLTVEYPCYGWSINFYSDSVYKFQSMRCFGYSIRPVIE